MYKNFYRCQLICIMQGIHTASEVKNVYLVTYCQCYLNNKWNVLMVSSSRTLGHTCSLVGELLVKPRAFCLLWSLWSNLINKELSMAMHCSSRLIWKRMLWVFAKSFWPYTLLTLEITVWLGMSPQEYSYVTSNVDISRINCTML
jgi:hypothetical protein